MIGHDPKNPFPKSYVVRLAVKAEGKWFHISCEMCNRILAVGDEESLAESLPHVLSRVVNFHMHEV